MVPSKQRRDLWPRHVVVTRNDGVISLRGGPALERRWGVDVQTESVELLAVTDDQVLLWLDQQGALLALDTGTGEQAWPRRDVRAVLEGMGGGGQQLLDTAVPREAGVGQGKIVLNGRVVVLGADEMRSESGLRVAVNEMVVCVADGEGRVVCIDRRSGGQER